MFVLPRLAALLALLLAAVLVMTQTLGLVHAITHGSSGSSLYSQDEFHDHDHDHDRSETDALGVNHLLASLFSLHHDVSDCRLFDQASHDGGLAMAIQSTLPGAPPPLTVAIFQGEAIARWASLFDARGPPLTV